MAPRSDVENTCSSDAECTGAVCVMGMCVSEEVEPLVLTLEVTPQRMLDDSEPQPALLGNFKIDGTTDRGFAMPRPYLLEGSVTNGGEPVAAEVEFVRDDALPKATLKAPHTASLAEDGETLAAGAFEVVLWEEVTYTARVTPTDGSLPPITVPYSGDGEDPLLIDYAEVELVRQVLRFENLPEGQPLVVRARSLETGEVISSRASVDGDEASLLLAPDAADYRIEIAPETVVTDEAAGPSPPALAGCDQSAPAYPSLSVLASALTADAQDALTVTLPALPPRIAFAGSVELCPKADVDPESIESLPVSLRSADLMDEGTPLEASLAATTSATYDAESRILRFCVELFAGSYEIVVTPPSSMQCAIFAEEMAVLAPERMPDAATGILLALPDTTYLDGTLQTTSLEPLDGASIEALALGVNDGIELEAGDASVTRYNRSRQGATGTDGSFSLPLDLGAYDVVFKPGADSGFGWLINTDVKLARRDFAFDNSLELDSPVLVQGLLRYPGGNGAEQATLEGAEVRAFTVLAEGNTVNGPRTVQVGKATADEDGRFMLLVTPSMPSGW